MIYLISGQARAGKDTAATTIGAIAAQHNLKQINLQISFYIKEYAKRISDWDGSEETKPRQLLQHLGTEIIRNKIDEYLFIRRIDEDIQVYTNFFDVITISDIRLKAELDYFKNKYQDRVVVLHIVRGAKITEHNEHRTEKELKDYQDFDYIIENNGTIKELQEKITAIVEKDILESQK